MKKIVIAVILVIMMLGIFTVCEADVPDISGLSTEELKELRDLIDSELQDDGIDLDPKYPIGYEVGKDIEAGIYSISVKELDDVYKNNYIFLLLSNGEAKELLDLIRNDDHDSYFLLNGDSIVYELVNGMHLFFEYGTLHLETK